MREQLVHDLFADLLEDLKFSHVYYSTTTQEKVHVSYMSLSYYLYLIQFLDEGRLFETSIFILLLKVVKEPIPFVYESLVSHMDQMRKPQQNLRV